MFGFLLRRKASALIWQYLDGVLAPDRLALLERLLRTRASIRQQFVDCAVLNTLLMAYYHPQRYAQMPASDGRPRLPADTASDQRLGDELAQLYRASAPHNDDEQRPRRTKRPAG